MFFFLIILEVREVELREVRELLRASLLGQKPRQLELLCSTAFLHHTPGLLTLIVCKRQHPSMLLPALHKHAGLLQAQCHPMPVPMQAPSGRHAFEPLLH